MVRLAGQAPRFFVQDNEQEEGFSGFIFENWAFWVILLQPI
jgi:hypothetical protein